MGLTSEYVVENSFWEMSMVTGAQVIILGLGLLYGKEGNDFESLFQFLWNVKAASSGEAADASTNVWQMDSITGGKNRLLAMHVNDFIETVGSLSISPSESLTFPLYLPCSDYSTQTYLDMVTSILPADKCSIKPGNPADIWLAAMNDCRQYLRSLDSHFLPSSCPPMILNQLKYRNGFTENFDKIWSEFLATHNYTPCSIFIAGNPQSGKTTIAKELASKLMIEYIDVEGSIRHILSSSSPPPSEVPEESVNPSEAAAFKLRAELLASIESKLAEGKKAPKKGEVEAPLDVSTIELNETLLSSIPPQIIRRCIASKIKNNQRCVMKGYVIDIWQTSLVNSDKDFFELMTGEEGPVVGGGEDGGAGVTAVNGDGDEQVAQSGDVLIAPKIIELFIEIQVRVYLCFGS